METALLPQHRVRAGDWEPAEMALLSNILAAYSYVSGSSLVWAGPGLRPGAGARSTLRREMLAS